MSTEAPARKGPAKILLRYLSEIVVIFLGITISFAFDQWNRDREQKEKEILYTESLLTDIELKKKELTSDSPSALAWINRLDSIDQNRFSETPDAKQLDWLHGVITSGDIFFFNPSTPSFSPSYTTDLWQELPDSIRRQVYNLYLQDWGFNELVYTELRRTISSFRNTVVIPGGVIAKTDEDRISLAERKLFATELRKPAYHNFMREVILQEQDLYNKNRSALAEIERVTTTLRSYLAARRR